MNRVARVRKLNSAQFETFHCQVLPESKISCVIFLMFLIVLPVVYFLIILGKTFSIKY